MARDVSQGAFRAQLVIPEQRQLFDYWSEKAAGRGMPDRSDISPAHFPRLLPQVSLIECEIGSGKLKVRLAGTRLREIYDREITGLYLDEIDFGRTAEYWSASYERVATSGRPAQGVVRGPRVSKEHLVQFWLKLPLSRDGRPAAMILCYDVCVPATDVSWQFNATTR